MPESAMRCMNSSSRLDLKQRANVLGVGISAVNMSAALDACDELLASREQRGYICVTGVHGVMEAQRDPSFRGILNRSFLAIPDGMPMVWVGHLQHYRIQRVYGPDFMMELCRRSVKPGYRHFFYGGNQGVAPQLADELRRKIPGLQVAGTYSPPFRPLNSEEEQELEQRIGECRPDIIWVGLSTPKQERFMASHIALLHTQLMVGVGAAFDVHTGGIRDAPDWMKKAGLQWLHRLGQEPHRLWKRYLFNNPAFLFNILIQLSGVRRYRIPL